VLVPGVARGPLAGGNLALITALLGTPYAAPMQGAVLVLEDVNEAVYRIDRMFIQLRLAGLLQQCSALVLGAFTHADEEEGSGGARSLRDVLREMADAMGVPCIAGAPVGHIQDQWTLPLGAMAELDATARTLRVLPDVA
jgi:muramoyltetrapeptide carboxypeptidase